MVYQQDEIRLEGKKIVLREKDISDAGNDYAWAADRKLMEMDAGEPFLLNFSTFLRIYPSGLLDASRVQFAIEALGGEHIGNCTGYNFDRRRNQVELGIMIGKRAYWGQGYGSDAVRTMARFLCKQLGFERIVLHTLVWNTQARRCFARCGFVECGAVQKQGKEFVKMEWCCSPEE